MESVLEVRERVFLRDVNDAYREHPNERGIARVMNIMRIYGMPASYEIAYQLMWQAEINNRILTPTEIEEGHERYFNRSS